MSKTLCWRQTDIKGGELCDEFLRILNTEYRDPFDVRMCLGDKPFLRGVASASKAATVSSEALTLINAIERFGSITLEERQ